MASGRNSVRIVRNCLPLARLFGGVSGGGSR
jgi:hypothetical protein